MIAGCQRIGHGSLQRIHAGANAAPLRSTVVVYEITHMDGKLDLSRRRVRRDPLHLMRGMSGVVRVRHVILCVRNVNESPCTGGKRRIQAWPARRGSHEENGGNEQADIERRRHGRGLRLGMRFHVSRSPGATGTVSKGGACTKRTTILYVK